MFTPDHRVLFAGCYDGTMPVSVMPMEAFDSIIRGIVREALPQRAGPSGAMPLPSSPMDVVWKPVPLPFTFGQLVAPSSGLVMSELIGSDTPRKKKTCKYISRT